MAVPQGLAHFGGITSLLSATYTLAHGITPGVATLYVPPQTDVIFRAGPLVFTYDAITITLADCILDRISVQYGSDGRKIWALHILDRRWKWKFAGRISGYYNVRRGGRGGSEIVEDTSPFLLEWNPAHPHAIQTGSQKGYVRKSNVDYQTEMVNAITAARAYEANVTVMEMAKRMASTTLRLIA